MKILALKTGFGTGDSYEIFEVDDDDIYDDISRIINNYEYYKNYEISVPYFRDKKSAIAKYIDWDENDIYIIEKHETVTYSYSYSID